MTLSKNFWSFWYHSSNNQDWSRSSYIFIYNTNNCEKFWGIYKKLTNTHFDNGILFVMRDGIFPDWSSPENMNGGFVSIKLDVCTKRHNNIQNILRIWLEHLLSEQIRDNSSIITGLSLSPKNGHYILKIWLSEKIKQCDINFVKELPMIHTSKFIAFSNKY